MQRIVPSCFLPWLWFLIDAACLGWSSSLAAQSTNAPAKPDSIVIEDAVGTVAILTAPGVDWVVTGKGQPLKQHYQLRTGTNSRAVLRLSDKSVYSVGELTEIQILPPQEPGLRLFKGILGFFHRGPAGRTRIVTPTATAGIKGTEFVVEVSGDAGNERTTVSVIDGWVDVANDLGSLTLTNRQQGVVDTGRKPEGPAGFVTANILQWAFYYPAVVDVLDLSLTRSEQDALAASLAAYRSGDLLAALAAYPADRQDVSDRERVYHAALLLAVGQVAKTERLLEAPLPAGSPLHPVARALRTLIAAVKRQVIQDATAPQFTSELLAASYYEQSRAEDDASLNRALELARQAAGQSPEFGFAWARLAELEFSFGRTSRAMEALNQSLRFSPSNAQALAVSGFLLAAQNNPREAIVWFDRALAVDSALGNAWLGRGLCKIRLGFRYFGFGQTTGGEQDLLVAAALEPRRSLLRSYLGKAYAAAGDDVRANHELALAKGLDPDDPTPWLYSALALWEQRRVNEAIAELERSSELNDNRALFRSRLLLDQDQAVRSASLARIYQDAGMNEVAVREAARAVTYDYANYSAHLFLAESYNALRDPTRFNLRYETVWFNELLLANLLSPVGGTPLSQHISQQEYSRLFERDRIGLSTDSSYRSDGQYREQASQFGVVGNTAWALDLDYQHNNGVRPNNELDRIEWFSTIKQQITARDTLMVQVKYEDYRSGDNFQYYNPDNPPNWNSPTNGARPNFKFTEYQQPLAVGGWHHEWSPWAHTLVLGGRLATEQIFSDKEARQIALIEALTGDVITSERPPFDVNYHGDFAIYLAELNQLFQWNRFALSFGGRWQSGSFRTRAEVTNPPAGLLFTNAFARGSIEEDFNRWTGYGYLTLEPIDRLWLIGGLAYDDVRYPSNFRNPPLSSGQAQNSQLGPKGGLVWNPVRLLTLRGAYAKSLGGVSAEESYRLEQTQVAGFSQAFRSLIPESLAGSVSAPEFETYALGLDLKFPSRTYVGLEVQQLNSDVNRTVGTLVASNGFTPFVAGSTREQLRYREFSIGGTVNQLLGDFFAVGAGYSFNRAELRDTYPQIPLPGFKTRQQADLHKAGGYILFNHPSGFFARADATWYHQQNSGYTPALPGDDFVEENLYLGYRFLRRRAEVMFGVLNLSDQDYRLNPLSTYMELPRERAYVLRVNLTF